MIHKSTLYDIEYVNSKFEKCKIKRNGCVGCCTDIAFKDNHFRALRQTHRKLWDMYMEKGMAEQLIALQNYKSNGVFSPLEYFNEAEYALLERPCAFDDIGDHIIEDQITLSEYDSEFFDDTQ